MDGPTIAAPGKRCWLRFSLRGLIVFILVLGAALGWLGNRLVRIRQRQAALAQVEQGGAIVYKYQLPPLAPQGHSRPRDAADPPGSKIPRRFFGENAFAAVESIRIDIRDPGELTVLTQFPEVKRLNIHAWSRIRTAPTVEGTAPLASLTNLQTLTISGPLGDDALKGLDQLRQVRELILFRTEVSSEGMRIVGRLPELRRLVLQQNQHIDDVGLAHLAALPRLKELGIQGSQITDASARHLARLARLEKLALSGTSLSDAAGEAVGELDRLIELHLAHTNFGDAGVAELTRLERLRVLSLKGTPITDTTTAGLRVVAEVARHTYEKGIKATRAFLADNPIVVDRFLPGLNYTAPWVAML